jgi:hypothetical protein
MPGVEGTDENGRARISERTSARTAVSIAIMLTIGLVVFLFLSTTGAFYYKMASAVAAAERCNKKKLNANGKQTTQYQRWLAEIKRTLGQSFQFNIETHEEEMVNSSNNHISSLSPVIYVLNHPHLITLLLHT